MGKKAKKTNAVEDFLLGGISAGVSKTIAAPIERVKLLLQNQGESASITKPYTGIVDCFVRVPKEQGFSSFWRGNMANVIRYFPTQALNFMFKERYKALFPAKKTDSFQWRLTANVMAGGLAGATSSLVVYPLDFARTRLAVDVGSGKAREFTGTLDCIMKTAKHSGMFKKGGVYNGFMISCVGIFFYRGTYFGLYDTVNGMDFMKGASFIQKFSVGYTVTVTAGLISYPIDTVRRRMMMTSGTANAAKYKNSIDCFGKIMAEEGVGAYFKGAGSNVLRGLAGALVLVGFDYFKDFYIDWKYPEESKN